MPRHSITNLLRLNVDVTISRLNVDVTISARFFRQKAIRRQIAVMVDKSIFGKPTSRDITERVEYFQTERPDYGGSMWHRGIAQCG